MDYRRLGASGFRVPVLSFGTTTFRGKGGSAGGWDGADAKAASRMIDICLEAGANLFDSADGYSAGVAEELLGEALKGRRNQALISTKAAFRCGQGPNDVGASRYHLIEAVDAALRRLQTDHIDLFQLHGFDALTPIEETLFALDDLVRAGKIRYVGCSNYSGWHLMKSLAAAERHNLPRYIAHQAYYSLVGRDYEGELMPLALDQGIGTVVWSPLGWGRLTGRIRRGQPIPADSRLHRIAALGPQIEDEHLYKVVDVLDGIAAETGKSVPQIAINWLLQRPSVASVIVGARTEEQLRDNLGALGWSLTAEQMARLDDASKRPLPYPYWHQLSYAERNPPPV